jgi:WD40 repeat protein
MSIKFKEAINWSTDSKQWSIAFAGNSNELVTGGDDNSKISVWDINTGELNRSWLIHEPPSWLPSENRIGRLSLSDDNCLIANAGGTKLWDFYTGQIIRNFKRYSNSLELTSDGKFLIVFSGDITVWDAKRGKKLYRCVINGMFCDPVISSDGQEIVVKDDYDETIEVRSVRGWEYIRTIEVNDFKYMHHAKISPNNEVLVLSGNGGIRVVDYVSGQQILSIEQSNQPLHFFEYLQGCRVICFSPDSEIILLQGCRGYPSFWHARTGEYLGDLELKLWTFAISRDWSKIANINDSLNQITIFERVEV